MIRRLAAPALVLGLALTVCTRARPAPPVQPSRGPTSSPLVITSPDGEPIVRVVERVLPSVVNVTTDQFDAFGGSGEGTGTGFVVRESGVIVTNYHVVENAQRIRVITSGDEADEYEARVIGGDQTADLAVLKVEAEGLPVVTLGSSGALDLGQRVVALGYALGLEGGPSVTTGIVSALDRVITAQDPRCKVCENQERTYRDVIQTDAAINPGNSGGPLVNMAGQVVGINTAGVGAGFAENIGFAIAIDAVKPTIENAIEDPREAVAYLGVISRSMDAALALQLGLDLEDGAVIVGVAPGGPADRAGIRPGDVIVGFGGEGVDDSEELGERIRNHGPGDRVRIDLVSSDGQRSVTATLGVNPDPAS